MSTAAAVSRWLFLLLSLSSWTSIYTKETRIVCYYTNWSVYRPGDAKFTPQNINPYMCTHLIYAFGGFTKENTLKPFDKYQDIEKGGYAKFTGLKTYNKNLKTLLAIGGWNEGSTRFSPLVANEERRKELVKNSVKFLRQNHFDGLDLDWEYPAFRDGGKSRDKNNYAQFVQELREEFDREAEKTGRTRLLLTMAIPAGIEYVNKGYDIPKLTQYLDWMNILSYDYHSAFEPAVNHHAPLYPLEEDNEYNYDAELNIDYTIKHYLKLGADPKKLVLGIPTYGRSYTLYNPDAFEIGSPADGPGTMGDATRENGYLAYYEICDYIKNQEWEVEEENPKAMGPYAFKDNQWVGYDDENIIRRKAQYVAENGLGGIMFWAIDNDDFRGNCHGKPYPLIEAGKEALLQAYGITEDNLIAPPAKPIKSRTRSRSKTTEKSPIKAEEKEVKIDKLSNRRRNRIKTTVETDEVNETGIKETKSRRKTRRKQSSTTEESATHSSLKVVTPSYTTPEPPSTPDMGGAFKCEDEGFFPHPKDCKKYFWCLSGAGDSGIVAHQFTCPAGLYFNKAADSCDYTQNVLCNKKLQRPKSTTSASVIATSSKTSTTTAAPTFSTTRVPPKITAATSKTTYRISTTTEALDEYEDEYEDEEEDDEHPGKSSSKVDSEEDPKVIKELIDLIKKAGGIEQLERQLKLNDKNSSSAGDKTIEPTIEKSLYERVLSKALKNTLNSKKATYSGPRNSRGPQSESQNEDDSKTSIRGKINKGNLQYSSISRKRPTTTETIKSEDETDDSPRKDVSDTSKVSRTFKKTNELQYVNIRRGRVSTTTEAEENSVINRNKILGEESIDEEDENEDDESEDNENKEEPKKSFTPQYVNIRRQRPLTTEGPTTSKYVEIRRSTTEANQNETNADELYPKYQTIRRGTTAAPEEQNDEAVEEDSQKKRPSLILESSTEDSVSKYVNIRRGTTTNNPTTADQTLIGLIAEKGDITATFVSPNTEAGTSVPETTVSPLTKDASVESSSASNTNSTYIKIQQATDINESTIAPQTSTSLRPSLFHTRGSTLKTSTESTTQTLKVSQSNIKFRPRSRADLQPTDDNELSTTEKSTFSIRRGSSRFRSQTSDSQVAQNQDQPIVTVQSKRRVVSTTERIFDENRSFRPSELADLSSLTAVDFEKLKEFNSIERRHSRRPVRISTTTTTSTTEKPEESLKTSSRTLPLARKLIGSASFGNSKRIIQIKNHTTPNQINYSNIVRTTSTTTESIATIGTTSYTSPRTRRIIRRFRTTTSTPTTETSQEPKDRHVLEHSLSQNVTEPKKELFKQKQVQLFPLKENKEEENIDDSFEDNINEEEENIKLSESNIRENSELNTFGRDQSLHKFSGQKTNNIYRGLSFNEQKRIPEFGTKVIGNSGSIIEDVGQVTTEPNIVVRTRKIIRKIVPTKATTSNDSLNEHDVTVGRKRKIIRKFRPRFNQISNERENVTDEKVILTKYSSDLFSAGYRKTTENKTTQDESIDKAINVTSSGETLNKGRFLPKRIFRQKVVTEQTIAKTDEENTDDDFKRYRLRSNVNRNETASHEGILTTRLKRIKPSNTVDDLHSDDSGNKRKYIFRTRNNQVTEQNVVYTSTQSSDIDLEEEKETEIGLDGLNMSHSISTKEPIELSEKFNDSQTESNIDIIILNAQSVKNLSVTNEGQNQNHDKYTDDDFELTTTEYITDFPETSSVQEHQQSTTSIPTPSTESLLKRFGAKRQEYRPKFNRVQISTSTESTEIRKLPKYKSFSRKPVSLGVTDSNDKISSTTPRIIKSRFNAFRARSATAGSSSTTNIYEDTDETDKHDNNESHVILEETLKENQLRQSASIANVKNETDELDELNLTTNSIIANTILDDSYSTEDTTLFSNEYTTLENIDTTIKSESNNLIETETDLTEDSTVFTTMPSTETIVAEPTSSPVTLSTTKTPLQTSKTLIEESETTNEMDMEIQSTTDVLISSEETTTEAVSTTSPSSIINIPTTTQREKSTLPPLISRPAFIPSKSRLSSYRPKSKLTLNQLTTEKSSIEKEASTPSYRRLNKFSGRTTKTQKNILNQSSFKKSFTRKPSQGTLNTSTSIPLKKLYKYSTTRKYTSEDDEEYEESDNENEDYDQDENEDDINDEDDDPALSKSTTESTVQQKNVPQENLNRKKVNRPVFSQKSSTKVVNTPFILKPTEIPKINKELEDIDTTAIKLRNKNLFTKSRKANTPFVPLIPNSTQEGNLESTTVAIKEQETVTPTEEISTQENSEQSVTTEYPTTLQHVFAELDENLKMTTEESNNFIDTTTNKVERLVEVNRIVNVKTKEDVIRNHVLSKQKVNEVDPTLDKIGEVNRVTVIKIVDKNGKLINSTDLSELNQTIPLSPVYITHQTTTDIHQPIKSSVDAIIEIAKVQEIPAKIINDKVNLTKVLIEINNNPNVVKPAREERKFEIFGGSKITNFNINNKQPYYGKAEIIDGISHINIITPRPLYHTEASTISLEALFQTKQSSGVSDKDNHSFKDEILETEHSRFVNVRVLHPDESIRLEKGIRDHSNIVPIKVLKQDDEEVTMRAKVVEVKPVRNIDMIKISPIKIEMFKTVSNNLPIYKEEKQNIPLT